jgi:hypothetical protein
LILGSLLKSLTEVIVSLSKTLGFSDTHSSGHHHRRRGSRVRLNNKAITQREDSGVEVMSKIVPKEQGRVYVDIRTRVHGTLQRIFILQGSEVWSGVTKRNVTKDIVHREQSLIVSNCK